LSSCLGGENLLYFIPKQNTIKSWWRGGWSDLGIVPSIQRVSKQVCRGQGIRFKWWTQSMLCLYLLFDETTGFLSFKTCEWSWWTEWGARYILKFYQGLFESCAHPPKPSRVIRSRANPGLKWCNSYLGFGPPTAFHGPLEFGPGLCFVLCHKLGRYVNMCCVLYRKKKQKKQE
jgi:hypothetical protein